MSRASTDSAMPRNWLSLEHVPAYTSRKRDSLWRVRRSRGTHVRRASCSKCSWQAHHSLGEMDALRFVGSSARRQRQRLCTASRVDCSRQRQSEPRSAVLAALAQLQGSTEVPNMHRAVAHCHLMVVGGHVDSSGASGCVSRQPVTPEVLQFMHAHLPGKAPIELPVCQEIWQGLCWLTRPQRMPP